MEVEINISYKHWAPIVTKWISRFMMPVAYSPFLRIQVPLSMRWIMQCSLHSFMSAFSLLLFWDCNDIVFCRRRWSCEWGKSDVKAYHKYLMFFIYNHTKDELKARALYYPCGKRCDLLSFFLHCISWKLIKSLNLKVHHIPLRVNWNTYTKSCKLEEKLYWVMKWDAKKIIFTSKMQIEVEG